MSANPLSALALAPVAPAPAAPRPLSCTQGLQGRVTEGGYTTHPNPLMLLCNRVTVTERPTRKRKRADRRVNFAYTREAGYKVTRLHLYKISRFNAALGVTEPVTAGYTLREPRAPLQAGPSPRSNLCATAPGAGSERAEPGERGRPVRRRCYPSVTRDADLTRSTASTSGISAIVRPQSIRLQIGCTIASDREAEGISAATDGSARG